MIGPACTLASVLTISAVTVFVAPRAFAADPQSAASAGASSSFDALVRSFSGYKCFARPNKDAQMGFAVPGRVTEVLVRSGQRIHKGEILIRGDDAEDVIGLDLQKVRAVSKSTVDRAKAQAELARLDYEKTEAAAKGRAATPQELDRARLSFEAANADYETAKVDQAQQELAVSRLQARLDRSRILAPFDGIVDFVKVDPGQQTNENDKILRVVNVSPLWIDVPASTPETVSLRVGIGSTAWVLMEVGGKARLMEAKVIELAPTADASSRTRQVRLELANPDRPDGTPGEIVAGEPAWVRFTAPADEWRSQLKSNMALSQNAGDSK
jgi:hypothetical protein